jgi:hypothetical protein
MIGLAQQCVGQAGHVCQALNRRVEVARCSKVGQSPHKRDERLNFKMETARRLYDSWSPVIRKWAQEPDVEIEFRLGRKTAQKFDTNIGQETFQKLLKALGKYDGWESTSKGTYTVYYGDKNKRITVDEATDESVAVIKTKIEALDFELSDKPFDIRLGVAKEKPYEQDDEEMTSVKTKKRWSFVRKNLSIDLTQMQGDPDDKDSDEDSTWHVEFEIVNPKDLGDRNKLFALMHKIFDLLNCLSS